MNSLPSNNAPWPFSLRAFALALVIDNVVTALNGLREEGPEPRRPDKRGAFPEAELWQALRLKCGELSDLVCRADHPGAAAADVLGYLPKHFQDAIERQFGRKPFPGRNGSRRA